MIVMTRGTGFMADGSVSGSDDSATIPNFQVRACIRAYLTFFG